MKTYIIEGEYTLLPYAQKWAIPGTFPRRFWDIVTCEPEDLPAILASYKQVVDEHSVSFDLRATPRQQLEREERPAEPVQHTCARCGRPVRGQYRHCYRCAQYLKVRARIA